jgi:predicted DNA-binding transcriptional regulator
MSIPKKLLTENLINLSFGENLTVSHFRIMTYLLATEKAVCIAELSDMFKISAEEVEQAVADFIRIGAVRIVGLKDGIVYYAQNVYVVREFVVDADTPYSYDPVARAAGIDEDSTSFARALIPAQSEDTISFTLTLIPAQTENPTTLIPISTVERYDKTVFVAHTPKDFAIFNRFNNLGILQLLFKADDVGFMLRAPPSEYCSCYVACAVNFNIPSVCRERIAYQESPPPFALVEDTVLLSKPILGGLYHSYERQGFLKFAWWRGTDFLFL